MAGADICFLATSKSGLGHLRRLATIARRSRDLAPGRALHLLSNARPDGLSDADMRAFSTVQVVESDRMAEDVAGKGVGALVLDTLNPPGIDRLGVPLALVLREMPQAQLHRFRLDGGRPWDLLVIANPRTHWMPEGSALPSRETAAVGWIYRPTGPRPGKGGKVPSVLVATGGGGTPDTARALYAQIDAVLTLARQHPARPFEVVQAIGPRAAGFGRLANADRTLDPGPDLNARFRDADFVISTAGYNSVLELATTDTPALLVPIPRSIDDQAARARAWGPRLGSWHEAEAPARSALWLVEQIAARRRRPPVDLGPSGEDAAARAILGLG